MLVGETIQLLQLNRTISLEDSLPEETARRYLKQSGAHALMWGIVHNVDGQSAPRLYWTIPYKTIRAKKLYLLEKLELPALGSAI
jgi:hypothetical protein